MNLSDFDYNLPPELIAQHPALERDGSRMMVLDREKEAVTHHQFSEILEFFSPDDLLVMNNTRVLPARVIGQKKLSGGQVELFFLEPSSEFKREWEVLLRSNRRPKPGQVIVFDAPNAEAIFLEDRGRGKALIRLEGVSSLVEFLLQVGQTPLPPYIHRDENESDDVDRYQTVVAAHPGAVAAPTAGLHFTKEVLENLSDKGVDRAEITLHVGLGTFQPIEADDPRQHVMEEERYSISKDAANAWHQCRERKGTITAVGSTSVRTLETAYQRGGIAEGMDRSDLYIYPPYKIQAVDRILTNFHLPKSTLLLMMSAFAGRDFLMRAYDEAVKEKYRFYSYGDCMLIV